MQRSCAFLFVDVVLLSFESIILTAYSVTKLQAEFI